MRKMFRANVFGGKRGRVSPMLRGATNMINSEDKVRLALQILAIVMVWISGLEWVSIVLVVAILPWKPIYPALKLVAAVGGWMAQPVADRVEKMVGKKLNPDSNGNLEGPLWVG